MRQHSVKKIPIIIILGKKEENEQTISIRKFGSENNEIITLSKCVEYFKNLETQ
ncbi:MAG: hypothetical protein LBF70_00020 [Holosporales bacterium]|nr:hypothetical protein [Holosporales bacterium]